MDRREQANDLVSRAYAVRAERYFKHFIPWASPQWKTPVHLPEMMQAFQDGLTAPQRVCFSAPPQFCKDIADDTPILTRRGWLTVGDVVVGDELVASDGGWTKVLGVYPQGEVQLYRVTFTNGKSARDQVSLEVGTGHLWTVRRRFRKDFETKTTAELAGDLRDPHDARHLWQLPVVQPIVGLPKQLPVDPYLLGVWLGDGDSACGMITTADAEIISAFAAHFPLTRRPPSNSGKADRFCALGLQSKLRPLGVLNNKHVPDIYRHGDVATRLSVLQGLCDSDGTAGINGAQYFVNTSPRLIDDAKWLVSSLGGTWTDYGWRTTTIPGRPDAVCAPSASVYFRLPAGLSAFRLPRKACRVPVAAPRNRVRRYMHSIAPSRRGLSTCFRVDAPDSLFTVGRDLVLTHNTTCINHGLIWHAWKVPGSASAYLTYGTDPARARAIECRDILARLPWLKAKANTERIRFENGSQIIFASAEGAIESHAVTGWAVLDDPYKNPTEATSSLDRKRIEEWFFGVLFGRLHVRTSMMVNHHRWTEHDLIALLARQKEMWRYVNYPAIRRLTRGDDGYEEALRHAQPDAKGYVEASLWQDFKSIDFLRRLRTGVQSNSRTIWDAYYQGDPQPEGGRLFQGTWPYEPSALPRDGYSFGIGIDCAYGDRKGGDWNVIVVLMRKGRKHWVLEVHRTHEPSPSFKARLKRVQSKYPGAATRWDPGPAELGLAQELQAECRVQIPVARKSKKLRAEHCAAAWNEDPAANPPKEPQIFVPRDGCGSARHPWADDFLNEVHDFTGLDGKDLHDDQVDALASAFEAVNTSGKGTAIGIPGAHTGDWGGLVTTLN